MYRELTGALRTFPLYTLIVEVLPNLERLVFLFSAKYGRVAKPSVFRRIQHTYTLCIVIYRSALLTSWGSGESDD